MGLFRLSCARRLDTAVCRCMFAPVLCPGKGNEAWGIIPDASEALGLGYVALDREIGGVGTLYIAGSSPLFMVTLVCVCVLEQ